MTITTRPKNARQKALWLGKKVLVIALLACGFTWCTHTHAFAESRDIAVVAAGAATLPSPAENPTSGEAPGDIGTKILGTLQEGIASASGIDMQGQDEAPGSGASGGAREASARNMNGASRTLNPTPASPWGAPLTAPLTLVRDFEAPAFRYGPGHRGIDLQSTRGAVFAVDSGTVRFAGMVAGRPVVSIQHPNGLVSTYEPVKAQVNVGEHVNRGQQIGSIEPGVEGSHCPGNCIHLGAKRGNSYLDPTPLLEGATPSVLYTVP